MSGTPVNGFGYFGKVPARGDFIQGNLPADFCASWSEWLQAVLAVSREQLGEAWLDCYLTSPIWHFALSGDVCGETGMVGTLMPSVDQVGRHFHFTIARPVREAPVCFWQHRDWSTHAEETVLQVLDDDTDMLRWAESVETVDWFKDLVAEKRVLNEARQPSQMILHADQPLAAVDLLHQQLRARSDRYALWWTAGSDRVGECCLVTEGMPLVSQFAAMLDGQWDQWGW